MRSKKNSSCIRYQKAYIHSSMSTNSQDPANRFTLYIEGVRRVGAPLVAMPGIVGKIHLAFLELFIALITLLANFSRNRHAATLPDAAPAPTAAKSDGDQPGAAASCRAPQIGRPQPPGARRRTITPSPRHSPCQPPNPERAASP